jgi:hypothetical protein
MTTIRYAPAQVRLNAWAVATTKKIPGIPEAITHPNGEYQTYPTPQQAQTVADYLNNIQIIQEAIALNTEQTRVARTITINAVNHFSPEDQRTILNLFLQKADENTFAQVFHSYNQHVQNTTKKSSPKKLTPPTTL